MPIATNRKFNVTCTDGGGWDSILFTYARAAIRFLEHGTGTSRGRLLVSEPDSASTDASDAYATATAATTTLSFVSSVGSMARKGSPLQSLRAVFVNNGTNDAIPTSTPAPNSTRGRAPPPPPSRRREKQSLSKISTLAELSDAHFAVLQTSLDLAVFQSNDETKINTRELVERLGVCRINLTRIMADPRITLNLDDKASDLSRSELQPGIIGGGNLMVQKRGFRKFLSQIRNQIDPAKGTKGLASVTVPNELPMNYNPPPPPPGKSPNDFLSLAFYYHEDGNLELSAFYIKKAAAADAHPLALHLLGLLRRHGWGVVESKHQAFLDLLTSCEKTLLMIPNLFDAARYSQIAHSPRKAFSSSSAPSRVSATQSESLSRSSVVSSNASIRGINRTNGISQYTVFAKEQFGFEEAISILPLPLFEIGVCFQQGWGIAKSIPAAFYFYKAAAALGDPDACYELGYLILHRVNRERAFGGGKREAARWLRKAHEAGRAVVGESWIFKRKWGGSDP